MQENTMSTMSSALGIFSVVFTFAALAVVLLLIVSMWKVFTKAGQPGWASLIPFYNTFVMLEITGKPAWWLILLFIPFVNVIVSIVLCFALATAFNKSALFGLGLLLLGFIFFPLLAFGDAEHRDMSPARM